MTEQNDTGDIFAGRTIFSGAEAAEYVGVPVGTFKNHVFVRGAIPNSKMIGNRRCFTRDQLNEYRIMKSSQKEFDLTVYTFKEAAEYLCISIDNLRHHAYKSKYAEILVRESIGSSGKSRKKGKGGGMVVFTKDTLDNFKAAMYPADYDGAK